MYHSLALIGWKTLELFAFLQLFFYHTSILRYNIHVLVSLWWNLKVRRLLTFDLNKTKWAILNRALLLLSLFNTSLPKNLAKIEIFWCSLPLLDRICGLVASPDSNSLPKCPHLEPTSIFGRHVWIELLGVLIRWPKLNSTFESVWKPLI
jgi:hypothetical protein